MKNILKSLVVIVLFSSSFCFAGKIDKAFAALEIKDYFKAKNLFEQSLKADNGIANFGLAILYSRENNPFHEKDSAYNYCLNSEKAFLITDSKTKLKYATYNWTESGIDSLKRLISSQFYHEIKKSDSLVCLNNFVRKHPWASEYSQVKNKRDSIAFFSAVQKNTSSAYLKFLINYPETRYDSLAVENYYNAEFDEYTGKGKLEEYVGFIQNYPGSPMKRTAEDKIFEIVTAPYTEVAFKKFLTEYPENHNVDRAWSEYYQLYIRDYSKQKIQEYMNNYPEANNLNNAKNDLELFDVSYLPAIKYDQMGYMGVNGQLIIQPVYDYVTDFVDGIALVQVNGKIGGINKRNNLVIPIEYSSASYLGNGLFLVEQNELYGIVDRNNRSVLSVEYEEVGEISNGLIYCSKKGKYGFVDLDGNQLIEMKYTNAFDFVDSLAIVESSNGVGVINRNGDFIIEPNFQELICLNEGVYRYKQDSLYGMLNHEGDTISSASWNFIGSFRDGFSVVNRNDSLMIIDLNGEIIVRGYVSFPNFQNLTENYSGNIVMWHEGEGFGRITTDGTWYSSFKYEEIINSKNGFIGRLKGKYGFVKNPNQKTVPFEYDEIQFMNDSLLLIRSENKFGVINIHGDILVPAEFDEVRYIGNNAFSVKSNDLFGVFMNKEVVCNVEYSEVNAFNDLFVQLKKNNSFYYLNLVNNSIISLQ